MTENSMYRRFFDGQKFIDKYFSTLGDCSSMDFKDNVIAIRKTFEDLTREVTNLQLFSPNENYKELPPRHIPYLLLPAYLGMLVASDADRDNRAISLKTALIYFKDYMTRVVSYEIVDFKLPWKDEEDDDTEQSLKQFPKHRRVLPRDPNVARQQKIQAYKECQSLESALSSKMARLNADDSDDEEFRDAYLTRLRYWANKIIQEMHSIEAELPLAQRMAEIMRDAADTGGDTPQHRVNEAKIRLETPLRPIIITRDIAQKAVYGLGYPSLPTMTVDEWYNSMTRDGYFTNRNQQQQPSSSTMSESQKEDDSDDDAKLQHQRKMDEYKDDHRRGWGNTHNKG